MVDARTRKRFKKLLIENGKTITGLAAAIGISRQYFSRVLNGKTENYRIEMLIYEYTRTKAR